VESDTASSQFWERGKPVQLKHTVHLSSTARILHCFCLHFFPEISLATFALCLRFNRTSKLILRATSMHRVHSAMMPFAFDFAGQNDDLT
jgi:hypothetical protein